MKQKKSTYFLIASVIVIWGIVIYKVVTATNGESDNIATQAASIKKKFDDYAFKTDTTSLLLNYRNPFGSDKFVTKDTVAQRVKEKHPAIVKGMKEIPENLVKYVGYVANAGKKKILSLVIINGKSVMLAEGEMADDVKLIKNMQDSIRIRYKKRMKTIARSVGS